MIPGRKEYEMTEADLDAILEACKPVTYIVVGGIEPRSPQQNANDAWRRLSYKMGFISDTVWPVEGKGMRFFSAVPNADSEDHDLPQSCGDCGDDGEKPSSNCPTCHGTGLKS